LQQLSDVSPGLFDGPGFGLAQQSFELGEDLLDRVEVGAIGRQEEQLGAHASNGSAHSTAFMTAEIVHDDDIAWTQARRQHVLDVGQEAASIDWPLEDEGCLNAVVAQSGEEGQGAPAAMWHLGDQALAATTAAVATRHVGLGPGLVDENKSGRINPLLVAPPLIATTGYVGPVLLAGVQTFF